ncbi:MAG: substrate-binding domain-containing protein [Rhodobacteraceae bacterium]|nr:substrate-binding domain-containing protein [Paracoccaceae bacterium]
MAKSKENTNKSPENKAASPVNRRVSGKPTLKTISEISGLAVPTVSRALNDAPDIGAETKKRVRRIADEIGYVPNRAGVRLRTGRTNVISLVLSTEQEMMNHTARLIASIAGGLRSTPYHLIVTPYFPSENPMKPIRYLVETNSADAVIFNQILPDDPRVEYLMERGFPFAAHGRTIWEKKHAWYDFDNHAFASIGVNRMASRGRRKILVIAPPTEQNYAKHIIAGVYDAAADSNVEVILTEAITSDSLHEAVMAYVTNLLNRDPSIDGILCASPSATMAAVAGLEAAGRVVGQDIDVFAKEAIPFLQLFRPKIIAMQEDVRKAGEFLARAAIQAIKQPDAAPMQGLDVPLDEE